MSTAIICMIILVICIFGVKSYVNKLTKGGGCCGERDADVKKQRVADRNKSHYPYEVTLNVEGMSCGNCANRVANALNSLEGVWAIVNFEKKTVHVRMKQQLEVQVLKDAILEAGYVATVR